MVKNSAWLKQFLESDVQSQSFCLDAHGNFNFRLSDNSSLVNATKTIKSSCPDVEQKLNEYLRVDDQMINTPIWIKMENESILSLSLADIYHFFLKYLKNSENGDYFFNAFEVSFLGPLGPYQHISLVECINEELLSKFIFKQVLKNKIPSRALRVRTHQNIGVTFGKELKLRTELTLKQITDSGLLFETTDDFFINNMDSGKFLKFYINPKQFNKMRTSHFKDSIRLTDQLLYTRDEDKYFSIEQAKIVKSLGYRSSFDNTFHLFCRYNHVLEEQAVTPFKEFSEQVKDIFLKAA